MYGKEIIVIMKKILFIYNPVSGKGAIRSKLSYIVENLSTMGVVTVMPTKAKGDATIFVVENMDNFDTIICSVVTVHLMKLLQDI